jgi:CO/xanthine dehydrogenase FAD-binding subunit
MSVTQSSSFFKPSSYFFPSSLEEAADILDREGQKAMIVAGGTGIYEFSQRGLLSQVTTLVDLKKLNLSYITRKRGEEEEVLRIGASTTLSDMEREGLFGNVPFLACVKDALLAINPRQVKNVATVGGSVCMGVPFFDLPTALCCLGASVEVVGKGGRSRSERLTSFFRDMFTVNLAQGEFVREISIPLGKRGSNEKEPRASAFVKFSLTADDWAVVNSACFVTLDASKSKFKEAVVTIGGNIGGTIKVANSVSQKLRELDASEEGISKACSHVVEDIEPESDVKGSAEYRQRLSIVLAKRAIMRAIQRIKSK